MFFLLILQKEFDMDIDPDKARPILEKGFSQKFRSAKSKLRNKYLKKDDELIPRRIAMENRPDDIDKVQWESFVDMEYGDRKRKQCKKNTKNKTKVIINHTLGRKSYRTLYDELVCSSHFLSKLYDKLYYIYLFVYFNRKTKIRKVSLCDLMFGK